MPGRSPAPRGRSRRARARRQAGERSVSFPELSSYRHTFANNATRSDYRLPLADYQKHQPDREARLADPEEKHPFDQIDAQIPQRRSQQRYFLPELGLHFGDPLLQLRIEPREVEVVQLAKLGAVGSVELVEPVHHLVHQFMTELPVELLRQLDSGRHCGLSG